MITIDTRIRDGSVEFLLHPEANELPVSGVLRGWFQFRTATQRFQLEWRHTGAEGPAGWGLIPIPEIDEPLCGVDIQGVDDQHSIAIPFDLRCHRVVGLWLESEEQVAASLFRPRDRVKDEETLAFQVYQLLRYADWRRETAAPLAVLLAYKSVEGHVPNSGVVLAQQALEEILEHVERLQPNKEFRKDREQIRLSAAMALVHVLLMCGDYKTIEPVIDCVLSGFRPSTEADPFHHGENRTRLLLLKAAIHAKRGDRSASRECGICAHYAAQEALSRIDATATRYKIAKRIIETVECALGDLGSKGIVEHFLRLRRPKPKSEKLIKNRLIEYLDVYLGQDASDANGQPGKL